MRRPRPVPRRHKTGPPRRQTSLQLESPACCPSPCTPPQSAPQQESDLGPGAAVLLRVPLGPLNNWCKARGSATHSFPAPPPPPAPPPTPAVGTHPSYTWVKPKTPLCKRLEAGTDQGVKTGMDGLSPVGERRKGPFIIRECKEGNQEGGNQKVKKTGKECKAEAPGSEWVRSG